MLSTLYRTLTTLSAPFLTLYLRRRRAYGREDSDRFAERFGYASCPRPAGRLIWCHAASVGEAASLFLLIDKMHSVRPDLTFLLTTGTVTAARMMLSRLPSYAVHQYMPVDRMACVTRFLDNWQPDLALWVESELWPNMLGALHDRLIPAVLLNARMSDRSFRRWRLAKKWAAQILSSFSLCLAQTPEDGKRFEALGATPVKCVGNLKYASLPLPCDARELEKLKHQIGTRPIWLMASTHRGEENMALAAHRTLSAAHPDIVTVIAPRHAVRGDEVAQMLTAEGVRFARRSKNEFITSDSQIYLADTMGELGLLYRLCPAVVMGGSFVRIGGHNPIEPAQADSAIILGPYMTNFTGITREFLQARAAVQLKDDHEMAFAVGRLLGDTTERHNLVQAARFLADRRRQVLDLIAIELEPFLAVKPPSVRSA